MAPNRPDRPRAASDFMYVRHAHKRGQDVNIDMQYAKDTDPLEFAEAPWEYCKNDTNCYLGLRFGMRDEFKQKLKEMDDKFQRTLKEMEQKNEMNENDDEFQHRLREMQESDAGKRWERVVREEERIKQTQVNFASYPKNHQMIERLKSARNAWKREVKERLEVVVEQIKRRGALPRFPGGYRDQTLDLELLERVRFWREEDDPENESLEPLPEREYGFKANAIYFKKSEDGWQPHTYDHPKFNNGKFPNQKILVHDLIQNTPNNPLSEPCREDRLRYFHFPSNNMRWIEEAMARYYDEDSGSYNDTQNINKRSSRAEKLLSRENWRGQLRGGGGVGGNGPTRPVHARHMRPRCLLIPLDILSGAWTQRGPTPKASKFPRDFKSQMLKYKTKNFAIFLPYLHWETNNRRAKMAEVIKEVTKEREAESARKAGWLPTIPVTEKEVSKRGTGCLPWSKRADYEEKPRKERCKLGKYLMSIAQVADAMDYEAEERLLRENLYHDPPLHIRRTLHQSYFSTLKNTAARDEDQVVYRGTREGPSFHTRNTRVVMVDQLWLWILDGNTIITSFPRRWGRNKLDPSDVHTSLRERLEGTPEEEIQSIYDLALIIIDQCSRVFFDSTKPLDQRPEVMDLLASTIGSITEHTAIAHDSFWRHRETLGMKHESSDTLGSVNLSYFDLNPEGTLLRESQDVAEELQIMLRIYDQQLHVVRDFRKILGIMNGESKNQADEGRPSLKLLRQTRIVAGAKGHTAALRDILTVPESTIQEANDLLELIRNRKSEIQDLEDAALKISQQLWSLLSLKQHQANIIESKRALARADENAKQGRAIMAFTLVTIFFLPLGFLAAFFGMNNQQINQSSWMTLGEQLKYMFGLSAAVIAICISIAFSSWARAALSALVKIPIIFVLEYTGIRALWKKYIGGHGYSEEKNRQRIEWIRGHGDRVQHRREEAAKKAKEDEDYERAMMRNQRATFKLVDAFLHGEMQEAPNRSESWLKRRPRINRVNVGASVGSGALDDNELDIERGQRIVEDGT